MCGEEQAGEEADRTWWHALMVRFCAFLILRLPWITDLDEDDTLFFFSPFVFKGFPKHFMHNELFCYQNCLCSRFDGTVDLMVAIWDQSWGRTLLWSNARYTSRGWAEINWNSWMRCVQSSSLLSAPDLFISISGILSVMNCRQTWIDTVQAVPFS